MKKKQLKKIKKIIGVLSAIVQEHEGREVRNMLKHSVIRPYEGVDAMSDKPVFVSMYERMAWEIENSSVCLPRMSKEEPKNLGLRRVGKIGIVIGKDPDKKILSHPNLYNLVGEAMCLYQDATGYFVILDEEPLYLLE